MINSSSVDSWIALHNRVAAMKDYVALARAGHIRAHVERFSLQDARLAYDRLRAGQLNGRAVVVPRDTAG